MIFNFTWRWKLAIGVFLVYDFIARWCDFNYALGLVNHCRCLS